MSSRYLDGIDAVTGAHRHLARITDVLGSVGRAPPVSDLAMQSSKRPTSMAAFLRDIQDTAPADVADGVGTLVGAGAGFLLWPNHRVLGLIGGASLGRNLPAMLHPEQRNLAMCNLGVTGTAIFGSVLFPNSPVFGFLVGSVAGGAILYFGNFRR